MVQDQQEKSYRKLPALWKYLTIIMNTTNSCKKKNVLARYILH